MTRDDTVAALAGILGHALDAPALYVQALTHGSTGSKTDYQRLEFLGDRVLGLTIAAALYARYPDAPEGELSSRFNALVSGEACAQVARALDLPALVELGPQAVGDGGRHSDNIAADVMESVIGALFLDAGIDAARAFVLLHWDAMIAGQQAAPKHPKAALQEWAAGSRHKPPVYTLIAREGPDHAASFTVEVAVKGVGEARASGSSKQDAETRAAKAFMKEFG